jgi:hypothetical protein
MIKRNYLCHPQNIEKALLGRKKKKIFFFRKACQIKKKMYFCTRFERQAKQQITSS